MSQANFLLNALSPASRESILAHSREVELNVRASLHSQEEVPRFAYFITSGIASVVVSMAEGTTSETAVIGREGVTGAYSLLGSSIPPTTCFMQVSGSGYRIPFPVLRDLFDNNREIHTRVLEHVQQLAMTTSQIAACNNAHEAEARLARWLLMVRDRTQTDSFHLTQEFLSEMLGARRTTVALAAGTLQRSGFIEYSRGKIHILSPENLETAACDCYLVSKRLLDALYTRGSV